MNNKISNLDALFDTLCEAQSEARASGKKIESVLEAQYGLDLTDLPSYGGDLPADTQGVWSWDADRWIVGEGEFAIEDRDDVADVAGAAGRCANRAPRGEDRERVFVRWRRDVKRRAQAAAAREGVSLSLWTERQLTADKL